MACGKKIKVSFDTRDKRQLPKIEQNLTEPGELLNKVISAIKFQDLHDKKHQDHMKNKVNFLQNENQNL